MKILFIDTHSENVTIIYKCDSEVFTITKSSNRSHSEIAVPVLEEVLKKANITADELDQIIVVNGPGSFTGVRIGVTIAKTIGYSKRIPIKTITSLEMYGVSSDEDYDIVTVKDSKGVYSAIYKDNSFKDFMYQKAREFEDYVEKNNFKVLETKVINIEKIVEYLSSKESINPHSVNPIYIKEIDVLK